MIEKDLELLWNIQDYFRRTSWLDSMMSKIVSKYPLQDIGVIVWCFFVIGVIEIGRHHFWIASFNLVFAVGNYFADIESKCNALLQSHKRKLSRS